MNGHDFLHSNIASSSSNPYPDSHTPQPTPISTHDPLRNHFQGMSMPFQWSQSSTMSRGSLLAVPNSQHSQFQSPTSWQQPIPQRRQHPDQLQESHQSHHTSQHQHLGQHANHREHQQHHHLPHPEVSQVLHHQQQYRQQYQQQPHQQQTQHQGYLNSMPYNIPAAVLQDTLRISSTSLPVGSSEGDIMLLVRTLHDTAKNGRTYKEALDDLHNVNNHPAYLWKDYYLDNKPRIDQLVSQLANGSIKTTKKPSAQAYAEQPPRAKSTSQPPTPKPRPTHSRPKQPQPFTSGRHTINSLTTPAPVYNARLPAPNAEIKIPDPPSRSPTPPTRVVVKAGKNSYTPEDREYFIKFISWRLKQDPNQTRMELCEQLSEKVPSHTAASWTYHWTRVHDLADKILGAAQGVDLDAELSSSESEAPRPSKVRPKYKEDTDSEESPDSQSDADGEGESESDYDNNEEEHPTSEDEKEMGEAGGPFTDADMRIAAKHVASLPDWDNLTAGERWGAFHNKYPKRSAKSWAEYYRRNMNNVDKLARVYSKKRKAVASNRPSASISSHQNRPTGLQKDQTSPTSLSKRKFSADVDEEPNKIRRKLSESEQTS